MEGDGLGVGAVGHQAVVGPAGEHLGDHVGQGLDHLVAGRGQQRAVEDDVGLQVGLEVA